MVSRELCVRISIIKEEILECDLEKELLKETGSVGHRKSST